MVFADTARNAVWLKQRGARRKRRSPAAYPRFPPWRRACRRSQARPSCVNFYARDLPFLIAPRLRRCAEELLQEPVFAEEVRRELSYRPTASKFDYSNRIVRPSVLRYAA